MARPYVVVSGLDGRSVVLTRERWRRSVLARGPDGAALCWTHRKAAELRGVLPLAVA